MGPADPSKPAASDGLPEGALDPRVYAELRGLAQRALAGERRDHTLQTTALAHEAWLRLAGERAASPAERDRFAFQAARAMRQVLIEHARARAALKRSHDRREALVGEPAAPDPGPARDAYLVALDGALDRLALCDAELARLVELRFFGGESVERTAELLGVSARTVKRGWRVAKGWLHRAIAEEAGDG